MTGCSQQGRDIFQIGMDELKAWYKEYMSGNREAKLDPERDVCDMESREREVCEMMPNIHIQDGYCSACDGLLHSKLSLLNLNKDNIEWRDSVKPQSIKWQPDIVHFEASSRRGCRLCRLFKQQFMENHVTGAWNIHYRLIILGKPRNIMMKYFVMKYLAMEYAGRVRQLIPTLPGQILNHQTIAASIFISVINPEKELPFSNTLGKNLLDPNSRCLELAQKWLQVCSTEHTLCKHQTISRNPTRLLDVREDMVRLAITESWPKPVRYATLSHCWGKLDFHRLKADSLAAFMERIPINLLTKTFLDAISITRSLCIDYLWIDSLCIIQDSQEDWLKESSLMSSVYGSSTINLAAADAHDGSEGCFVQLSDYITGIQIEKEIEGVRVKWDLTGSMNLYGKLAAQTHLASRAWALQERLLSPRNLHFGRHDLFWECKEKAACETFREGISSNFLDMDIFHRKGRPLKETWGTVVNCYSRASLTYSSDKLVAISGIARAAQDEVPTDDRYLAGMWMKDSVLPLCWETFLGETKRATPYSAPTWSWASIDGEVFMHFELLPSTTHLHEQYAEIVDANVTLGGEDPFGEVRGGVLKLAANGIIMGSGQKTSRNDLDWISKAFYGLDGCHMVRVDAIDDYHSGETLYALPILAYSPRPLLDGRPYSSAIYGILLRQTSSGEKGQYTRVACFWYEFQNHAEFQEFSAHINNEGAKTARENCAEIITTPEGKERYIINII